MRNQLLLLGAAIAGLTSALFAADLRPPQNAAANTPATISTRGEGNGTFYLIGPITRVKRSVRLGDDIHLTPEDLRAAGLYTAIVRGSDGVASTTFFVSPGKPATISFLAQPSRVPASAKDAISGTAFVMDNAHNLVLSPAPVRFELTGAGAPPVTRTANARDGVAWTRIDSGRQAGNAQFTAVAADTSVRRVVQQVAADPCNLRIHAQPARDGILVETAPVRDCGGNTVPDGTIVTITAVDPQGKSTVDAVVKQGIARAIVPASSRTTITVASGVVIGNEIRWGGGK